MVQNNPEILKKMLGDKMPVGFLDNPANVKRLVFFVKYILKIIFFLKKIYAYRSYILVLLLAFIAYKYVL